MDFILIYSIVVAFIFVIWMLFVVKMYNEMDK